MTDLNLGPIGNCSTAALIDRRARIIWWCLPRFDGDPVFCKLLKGKDHDDNPRGAFEIALDQYSRSEQEYIKNTAILVTRLFDDRGGAIEITDFTPRFE
jgi:GH15 family glucan-1,4-alpha-glucosidase